MTEVQQIANTGETPNEVPQDTQSTEQNQAVDQTQAQDGNNAPVPSNNPTPQSYYQFPMMSNVDHSMPTYPARQITTTDGSDVFANRNNVIPNDLLNAQISALNSITQTEKMLDKNQHHNLSARIGEATSGYRKDIVNGVTMKDHLNAVKNYLI